jgi:MSHA type pilus biogenesis protein MshL
LNFKDLKENSKSKWATLWIFSFLIFVLTSCASISSIETKATYDQWKAFLENQTTPKAPSTPSSQSEPTKEVKKEPKVEPQFFAVSPLQKRITATFHQESYENVLSYLSFEAGLNFVLDPEVKNIIPDNKTKISLQFVNHPLGDILVKVCEILDVYPKIEKGVFYVQPYEERIFNLGFLPVVKESKTTLGGDVLGNIGTSVGGGLTSPIRGEVTVISELSKSTLEIYKNLEQTIKSMLSKNGVFQLNPSAGFLYVKDRPNHVKTVEKFINQFLAKYGKQIVLDAQIIEVALNKEHNLGIDWFEITNHILGKDQVRLDTLNLGLSVNPNQSTASLIISGRPNINAFLNFLKQYGELKILQNPKLRVLHSQPAIISVGTTFSYVKEVKRDILSSTVVGNTTTPITPVITYTTQTSSVFDGILLSIVPYIANDSEIYLHIVPIKSEIAELKNIKFGAEHYITLPVINLREMSSIVKAKPGDLIVIGGLILDKQRNNERRLAIPFLDRLFRSQAGEGRISELIILIRVEVD